MMNQSKSATIQYSDEVVRTAHALRMGQVVLCPTDSIWGLSCDVTNKSAIERVYEIKQRPKDQPLILLVDSIEMLKTYVVRIHPRIETLLTHHSKPLTIIYDNIQNVPDHLTLKNGSLGIRVCSEGFISHTIKKFGNPIVSTSANISGKPFPKNYEDIDPIVIKEADYVVDFERDSQLKGLPSIIAKYNHKGDLEFLRE